MLRRASTSQRYACFSAIGPIIGSTIFLPRYVWYIRYNQSPTKARWIRRRTKSNPQRTEATVDVTIVGIIFLLIEPYSHNKAVRFHAFQGLFLVVAYIVV